MHILFENTIIPNDLKSFWATGIEMFIFLLLRVCACFYIYINKIAFFSNANGNFVARQIFFYLQSPLCYQVFLQFNKKPPPREFHGISIVGSIELQKTKYI